MKSILETSQGKWRKRSSISAETRPQRYREFYKYLLNLEIIEVRDLANKLEEEGGINEASEYECDIDDEEGVQESNRKYFFDGSQWMTTNARKQDLIDRKKYIIHIFNQAYSESSDNSHGMNSIT